MVMSGEKKKGLARLSNAESLVRKKRVPITYTTDRAKHPFDARKDIIKRFVALKLYSAESILNHRDGGLGVARGVYLLLCRYRRNGTKKTQVGYLGKWMIRQVTSGSADRINLFPLHVTARELASMSPAHWRHTLVKWGADARA